MPSFKPFASVTGRNSYSLFDIRLDQDFIVFRGNDHESSGQLLKGVVVLCLSSPLRIEDIHLRLVGTLRLSSTAPGVSGQKVDKATIILDHRWQPFVGTHGKSMTLPAGNYEYPFEFMLPGDTAESVEGIREASITYRLKATVGRGKLAYDLHAYKHLRIIRTLEPGALEFLHAMSVENIWPNKVDYSIVIPQKAVVFGGTINMEMRFTPLLKGLELGDITAKMIEIRDCWIQGATGLSMREHRTEREVATWRFEVNREEHWQDMIQDTGQEGWALVKSLPLPKRLRQCIQDLNHHGIKVRHKIKLTVALKNPDGHISELRATLPVSIFISPNIPFDEQGNLLSQSQGSSAPSTENALVAPPGCLWFPNPSSPVGRQQSLLFTVEEWLGREPRFIGSPSIADSAGGLIVQVGRRFTQSLPKESIVYVGPFTFPFWSNSEEDRSGRNSTEHVDLDPAEFAELNRVPSYATAVRTPAWSRTQPAAGLVPDYQTALHAPRTPPATDITPEPLSTISEDRSGENRGLTSAPSNLSSVVANSGSS
ncbi:hypothetical protein MHUMG1_00416 [Metarhizium humberi]|uniref:Arrestin C-terminal-like domain-containing protein n=1 Tax=Metarhizium humberi TaxID=2596975 RepID=A0A9P8MLK7_9HYPO|nr:hypothetical protein MHUMG1_00416 [Metarhizium humberi]